MIIGITGKNGSGKSSVAQFLMDNGYVYYSLSDIIRDELENAGRDTSRENLIQMGNDLRASGGAGVLAEHTLKKLRVNECAVIDSIRNPFEVERLRIREDFYLISVEADSEVRFSRCQKRNRAGDSQNYEVFLDVEAREAASADPTTQQMDRTAEMADAVVKNNGTVNELNEKISQIIHTLQAQQLMPDWDPYFLSIANAISIRSSCSERKAGIVVVKDQTVILTGMSRSFNQDAESNISAGCHCFSAHNADPTCVCLDAEDVAIAYAASSSISVKGCSAYISRMPSYSSVKLLVASGISRIVIFSNEIMPETSQDLLFKASVEYHIVAD